MKTTILAVIPFLISCQTLRDATNTNLRRESLPVANSAPSTPQFCEGGGICGYETTRTYAESDEFIKDCKLAKKGIQQCSAEFNKMLFARISLRYPRADYDKVVLWCQSEPKICGLDSVQKANALETALAQSQNDIDTYNNQVKSESEARASRERIAGALKAFGQGMQQAPKAQPYYIQPNKTPTTTNCTTQMIGNQMQTNCTGN